MFVYTKEEAMRNYNEIMILISHALQAAELLPERNVNIIIYLLG
jgi:hypothetical protein